MQQVPTQTWIDFNDLTQIQEIISLSFDKPVVIFKHSTTCGISAGANHHLEQNWSSVKKDVPFYYLDLLRYRPISNAVAEQFRVIHQSPQVLIIKDGEATYSTSHHAIDVKKLNEELQK